MLELLEAILEQKGVVENNIEHLRPQEIEQLCLYEQLGALQQAENAMRSAIRAHEEAKRQHPELFTDRVPEPLVIE